MLYFYSNISAEEKWNQFVNVKEGASGENLARIKELFPEVPESLLELLQYADGTYHRAYGNTIACGTIGQIVMFVHDSDRIEVIADSFDEYLEKMIQWEFNFIVDEFE